MADLPPQFDLFQLLDTLARPPSRTAGPPGGDGGIPAAPEVEDPATVLNAALAGQGGGRVFRLKLGYNPNSSSLGTSVVVLLWGLGLAGVLFNLVGGWLLAASQPKPPPLPPGEGS